MPANVSHEYLSSIKGFWNFQMVANAGISNQSTLKHTYSGPYRGTGVERGPSNEEITITKPGLYALLGTLTVTATTGAPVITLVIANDTARPIINMNCPTGGTVSFVTCFEITKSASVIKLTTSGGTFSTGNIGPQMDITIVRIG